MSLDFLSGPVQFLKGIGPKRAEILADAGVRTVRDLLQYYPRRYLDRTSITRIRDLRGHMEAVTIVGTVRATGIVPGRRMRRFELVLEDDWGARITCVWFRGVKWISDLFEIGERLAVHGKPGRYSGSFSLSHPEFDRLDEEAPALDTGRIIALYPGSATLEKFGLTSRSFRRIIYQLIREQGTRLEDVLPESVRGSHDLLDGRVALRAIHFPKNHEELSRATYRLKFEEFFYIQLMLARMKTNHVRESGSVLKESGKLVDSFVRTVLPFELTGSQKAALRDIFKDTASGHRMNRLLQGDVGSGKTVVAVATMLRAVENGYQAALMAPTEILAEQHYRSVRRYLDSMNVPVRLLTGKMKKSARDEALHEIKTGQTPIVIGTHAVIQKGVEFHKLGLCVVDEQHRFGVQQRATLFAMGHRPHVLLMTATPIPRSLALTFYGDLDVTLMRDKPPGRQPIETRLTRESHRPSVNGFIAKQLAAGRQCYVVFPLVEESEKLDLKDAESGVERLREAFPGVPIDLVHGRMPGDAKDAAMQRFRDGSTQILVATTVIEVGVDVPNATLMMIEHAERFGLSQLHQLRGRIGRGAHKSTCILMADFKQSPESKERLKAMVDTEDGFRISELDLKIRGAGDFFGTRQSGLPDLKIADIVTDTAILEKAREAAFGVIAGDPELRAPENRKLAAYFDAFYREEHFGLSQVG